MRPFPVHLLPQPQYSSPVKSKPSSAPLPRRPQFSAQVIKKMLLLEQYFHNKQLNLDACNELVGVYIQGVEYFDRIQTSLRYYFLQKMQFVLSRPEVVDLLERKDPNPARTTLNNLRETLRGTSSLPASEISNSQIPTVYQKPKFDASDSIHYNEQHKKMQRSIKAQMYLQAQQQLKIKGPQLKAEIRRLQEQCEEVRDIILGQTSEVQKRMQERKIIMRKKRSERSSLGKKRMEESAGELPPTKGELRQMQRIVHQQVVRYTIRKTRVEMDRIKESKDEQERQQQIRETKGGGRINMRHDDDD